MENSYAKDTTQLTVLYNDLLFNYLRMLKTTSLNVCQTGPDYFWQSLKGVFNWTAYFT